VSAQALIQQAQASGVALRLVGGKVKASGPREAVARLLVPLREHRAALADALQAELGGATARAHRRTQRPSLPTGTRWTRPIWPTTSTAPLASPPGVAVGMGCAVVLAWHLWRAYSAA
jgi:hypothetical protein